MQINSFSTEGLLKVNLQSLTSKSIASGSTVTWQESPDSITGYKPIAVVGFETSISSQNVSVMSSRINGSGQIEISIRNNTGGSISTSPRMTILYIRN